ncbi:MAG: hypothetical protein WBA76_04965, partial [Phormidesmis sp.]
ANAAPVTVSEVAQDAEPASTGADMEIKIETQDDGSIFREFTFSGKADDIIVAYAVDPSGERFFFPQLLELYDSSGKLVSSGYQYPSFATFKQPQEFRSAFLLPITGEYRLVVEGLSVSYGNGEPLDMTYLFQIRTAGDYERLLIFAEDALIRDQHGEALERLAFAVEDSPELPTAYLSRVLTYADMLFSTPAFDARLGELGLRENDNMYREADKMFALVYETFVTLDKKEQTLLISDLRQLGLKASDTLVPEAFKVGNIIEPSLFTEAAEFLITGVPTDGLRAYFFGRFEPVEAPIVEPKQSEAL